MNLTNSSPMKPHGTIMAFTRERNQALLKTFRKQCANASTIILKDILQNTVNSPSPRFWVSEERAANVVSKIISGKPVLLTMRPTKREMFSEIHRRVIELKKQHPDWILCELVQKVITSPAPKFYMEANSLKRILCTIRKDCK